VCACRAAVPIGFAIFGLRFLEADLINSMFEKIDLRHLLSGSLTPNHEAEVCNLKGPRTPT
jgi:hypothetical protein